MTSLLEQYIPSVGDEKIHQLLQVAKRLSNKRLVHVSSTATGGGVAEILTKFVPLTQSLGIDTQWEIIQAPQEFFQVTKLIHNAVHGNRVLLSPSQVRLYEDVNRENAKRLQPILEDADMVVIHDPQPLAIAAHFPNRKGRWVWRCHGDASAPFKLVWRQIQEYIKYYDASIFSLASFAQSGPHPMFIIPPSIDPFSEKNIELDAAEIQKTCEVFGLNLDAPLILQVSRFDRLKDPLGVLEAYQYVKKYNQNAQLVLAGGGAPDDPEGEIVHKEIQEAAADDPNVHILMLPSDAHRTINALQRAAHVVLQKSIREGFGLTVTEALWKSKPVIGGNVGGIRVQLIDGHTGFLVNTPEGAACRIRYLLQHPKIATTIGKNGRDYIREKFLITRHLMEYLTLFCSLFSPDVDRIELL